MTGTGAGHSGEGAGNALKKGVGIVHGAGEAIRGNINAFADSVVGSKDGMAKDEAIVDRGVDEMNTGHYHGTGAGVTPADTTQERQNRVAQGEYDNGANVYSGTTTTTRGPHESNVANKVDPRIDSNLGTRR